MLPQRITGDRRITWASLAVLVALAIGAAPAGAAQDGPQRLLYLADITNQMEVGDELTFRAVTCPRDAGGPSGGRADECKPAPKAVWSSSRRKVVALAKKRGASNKVTAKRPGKSEIRIELPGQGLASTVEITVTRPAPDAPADGSDESPTRSTFVMRVPRPGDDAAMLDTSAVFEASLSGVATFAGYDCEVDQTGAPSLWDAQAADPDRDCRRVDSIWMPQPTGSAIVFPPIGPATVVRPLVPGSLVITATGLDGRGAGTSLSVPDDLPPASRLELSPLAAVLRAGGRGVFDLEMCPRLVPDNWTSTNSDVSNRDPGSANWREPGPDGAVGTADDPPCVPLGSESQIQAWVVGGGYDATVLEDGTVAVEPSGSGDSLQSWATLVVSDGSQLAMAPLAMEWPATCQERQPLLGDVNGDGRVNAADYGGVHGRFVDGLGSSDEEVHPSRDQMAMALREISGMFGAICE